MAALTALILAQVAKVVVHHALTGDWEPARCLTSGGMPSSHTAAAAALAAALAISPGPGSDAFAVAAVLAAVVCDDASGVRLHAGRTASVLTLIVTELPGDHPAAAAAAAGPAGRLREALGHTPVQVFAGAGLGGGIGLLVGVLHAWAAATKAPVGPGPG